MINISNLNLIYKQTPALNNVTFTLENGEILGITGPSGSGKSLLLKAVAGKIKTGKGIIKLNEKELSDLKGKELHKEISHLLPPYEYNPEATVFDEIIKGRIHLKKIFNPYSETDRESTDAIIHDAGLSEKASIRLKRCPDSIIRMTLIAQTINSESENILLDSPEYGLDPSQKLSAIRALKKYTARGDKSVLIASSEIDFLIKTCDRIIVLKNGAIHASGGSDIFTGELLKKIFGVDVIVVKNIITGLPEIHIINSH
ncbi:MAG TPA: ABC transporter ATP-binding protein [Spirochaetota bacterium]|nr:ABC transporter ATP-binding protein [Spirochaetota bacterium]